MNEQSLREKEEVLALLQGISHNPQLTQRELSLSLGISLGKTNYLLKELVKKGFIKVVRFSKSSQRLKRIKYMLTPKGLQEKARLVYDFLKRKEAEYNQFKKLWEELKNSDYKEKVVR